MTVPSDLPRAGQHVLVVDGDAERRSALVHALRDAGWQVVGVTNGAEAVAGLAEPGVDLLVLDLARPELDLAALRAALVPAVPPEPDSLEAAERRHIALMLRHTGGNRKLAARLLGISRSTLLSKIRRYGLDGD